MKAIDQRPATGSPLALDLLNTRWRHEGDEFDLLLDDDALVSFNRRHGVDVDSRDIIATRTALVRTREVIEHLFDDQRPDGSVDHVAPELDALLAGAVVTLTSTTDGPRLTIASPERSRDLAVQALISAVDLASEQPRRVRRCDHEHCVLWFLDTSKSGRRRWCSMDRCGNRAKARRHYERTRAANGANGTRAANGTNGTDGANEPE
ncbi:MAG: CGNR zinc finger domain-containing protein [Actinomycetes bacterium]